MTDELEIIFRSRKKTTSVHNDPMILSEMKKGVQSCEEIRPH